MEYEKFVGDFPPDWTQDQKDMFIYLMRERSKDLSYLNVVYTPDCGCGIKLDYRLDRYPMSPKIWHRCEICNKMVLAEISNPIRFYSKLDDAEYSLEDLKEMVITDTPQKEFILAYIMDIENFGKKIQ